MDRRGSGRRLVSWILGCTLAALPLGPVTAVAGPPVASGAGSIPSTGGLSWQITPPPFSVGSGLTAVAGNGTVWVLADTGGTLLTSADGGTRWDAVQPTTAALRGLAYGAGVFVAVGDGGTILVSPDGSDWTAQASGTTANLNAVAFLNGEFVAVGDGGTLLSSADGAQWTAQATGTVDNLTGAAYGDGVFVVVGTSAAVAGTTFGLSGVSPSGVALTSSDGRTWTAHAESSLGLDSVAFGAGEFLAVATVAADGFTYGDAFASTGGAAWAALASPPPTNGHLASAFFLDGMFLLNGSSTATPLAVSVDGTAWQTVAAASGLDAMAYAGGLVFGAASGGSVLVSADGLDWAPPPSAVPTTNPLQAVTYGDGKFVAVGYGGTILTSPDGQAWTVQSSGTTADLTGVVYGGGEFVAVGAASGGGVILTSPDGVGWTAQPGPPAALNAVAYGGGTFVAVGAGDTVLRSADGATWTASSTADPAADWAGVAYGDGVFSAVGVEVQSGLNYEVWATSADGQTWSAGLQGPAPPLNAVAYTGSGFVAVGASETILGSADGTAWSTVSQGADTGTQYDAVGSGGKWTVVAGEGGALTVSTDGGAFQTLSPLTTVQWSGVAWGDGEFVFVGGLGTILTGTAPAPVLSGLAPASGPVGTALVLSGSGFGTVPGSVYFTPAGGPTLPVPGSGAAWSDQQVSVPVPVSLPGGPVTVQVYAAGGAVPSGPQTFTVTPPYVALCPVGSPCGSPSVPSAVYGLTASVNGGTDSVPSIVLRWSWGDGTVGTGPFPQAHTYALPGTYTVTVTAVAADGLSAAASTPVTVRGTGAPAPTITAPVLASLAPPSGPVGTVLALAGSGFERPGTVSGSVYFVPAGAAAVVVAPTAEADGSAEVAVPSLPAGTVSVSVYNPSTGLQSNSLGFTVTAPVSGSSAAPPPPPPPPSPPGQLVLNAPDVAAAILAAGSAPTVTIAPTLSPAGAATVLLPAASLAELLAAGKGITVAVDGFQVVVPAGDLRTSALLQADPGLSLVPMQGAGLALSIQVAPASSVTAALEAAGLPLAADPPAAAGGGGVLLAYGPSDGLPLSAEAAAGSAPPPGTPVYAAGGDALGVGLAVVAADGSSTSVSALPSALTVTVPYSAAAVPDPTLAAVYELGAAGTPPGLVGGWADTATDSVAVDVTRLPADLAVLTNTETFSDIAGSWAEADIRAAAAHGIVTGFPGGQFEPNAPVDRAAFAAMLARTLSLSPGDAAALAFSDVPPSAWYAPLLATLVQNGLVRGLGQALFGPGRPLSRAELAVLAVRGLAFAGQPLPVAGAPAYADAAAIPAWAAPAVAAGTAAGLLRGVPGANFDPQSPAERSEAAAVLVRLLARIAPAPGGAR